MIKINLLPVREARRRANARHQLGVVAMGVATALAAMAVLHFNMLSRVDDAQIRLKKIEAQIKLFEPQIKQVEKYKKKKREIAAKLDVIEGLERSRTGPVHMLDELATLTPDRLWLTRLSAASKDVELEGISLDYEIVAGFLTALGQSPYFDAVDLETTVLESMGDVKVNSFRIKARLTSPEQKAAESAASAEVS